MTGLITTDNGFNSTGGGGGGGTPAESKAVKYIAQALTDVQKAQARENIGGAKAKGKEPNLVAGDLIPKSSEPIEVSNTFRMQTSGGDYDLKSGPSFLQSIRCSLDASLNPFLADTFVSTGMNLVDPSAHVTIGGKYAYIFPVAAGNWGSYGSTQENNGYIVLSEVAPNGVYFKATKPTGSNYGEACPTQVSNGKTYYLPPTDGWLCIAMPDKTTVPACHIAWSNYNDAVPGTFGNTVKDIAALVQWIHTWGMAGIVGVNRSIFDEIDLVVQQCHRVVDRTSLAGLTWTMTTVVTGEGQQQVTTYIFKATISTMMPDGLWVANYDGITVEGNELTIRSTSITSVADLQTSLGTSLIYFELATPVTESFANIGSSINSGNVSDDFGLTYFLYNGDLASVPAHVNEAFYQSGKDPLYNAVTYQKILAEVMATVMASVDQRLKSQEEKKTVECTDLIVRRRANIEGWREVSAPASATAPGKMGDYSITTDYLYVCVADNTWKRVALSTF